MKLVTQRSSSNRVAKVRIEESDLNMQAAEVLFDMAGLQANERSRLGYKRAGTAIVSLPGSVADLVASGGLAEVTFVGPASARIVTEFVADGRSSTVEAALSRAGADNSASKALRAGFLSHHAMLRALEAKLPSRIVSRTSYRGDFQMHSTWSDGAERLGTMALAAMALGHTCLGITDHSHGLPVARGMSMASVARQHREAERLNDRYAGHFRIFKGIEANILVDGGLDLTREERRRFEFVVASPHSQLRRTEDQASRMVRAVRQPGVAILGHPRGRMFNKRVGVAADWDAVFAAAAASRVAVELDGNWHRQDLDHVLARRALDAGCLFALDSDAHSIPELRFSEYAVAHARLAGIPTARVINCWSDEALDAWMAERRQP